jgi:hypothetical protein
VNRGRVGRLASALKQLRIVAGNAEVPARPKRSRAEPKPPLQFLEKLVDAPTGLANDAMQCVAMKRAAVEGNGNDVRRNSIVYEMAMLGRSQLSKTVSQQDTDYFGRAQGWKPTAFPAHG